MKISRKEYIVVIFLISLGIALYPVFWLSEKWDKFWNDKIIEIKEVKK